MFSARFVNIEKLRRLSISAIRVTPQRSTASCIGRRRCGTTLLHGSNFLPVSAFGGQIRRASSAKGTDMHFEQKPEQIITTVLSPFMTPNSIRRLQKLRKLTPRPLSMASLLEFAEKSGNETRSYIFLREELPIRLANMIFEMATLPDQLLHQPSAQEIIKWYCMSFKELEEFHPFPLPDTPILEDFAKSLEVIVDRHREVVETMAHALIEYQKEKFKAKKKKMIKTRAGDIDAAATEELDRQLSRFLDRFFMSRIGIRLLINQHITLFTQYNRRKPEMLGSFDKQANIEAIVRESYDSASSLCDRYYMETPPLEITVVNTSGIVGNSAFEICYVPSHLHHICFELFKNAQRATMDRIEGEEDPTPVSVLIGIGKSEISIKISDRGGGAAFSTCQNWLRYIWSTAPKPACGPMDTGSTPMAGYGVGLPISRLYARYLSGDLKIQSVEGYGTDAVIYLKRDNAEAVEVLPNYVDSVGQDYKRAEVDTHGQNTDSWMGGSSRNAPW